MAENLDGDDLLKMYTAKMGKPFGPFFHHLWQDLAHLHLQWNEYLPLFGANRSRVDTLNKAAPHFFGMVQDVWWNDLLLRLWKLTDKDTRTLSVLRLPELAPALAVPLEPRIKNAVAVCKFAHKVRHNLIAHRNTAIAMKVSATPPSSRTDVKNAIDALDGVFNFVHGHYTGEDPMLWGHLDGLGGSESVLWIVRRGLKAREDDFAARRPPMRFHD